MSAATPGSAGAGRSDRKRRSHRSIRAAIGLAASVVSLAGPLAAQDPFPPEPESYETEYADAPPLRIVSGAFAHLNVVGSLDATYGGLSLDRVGETWGFSGSVMVGRGSEGGTWVHLPLAGLIAGVAVLLPLSFIHDFWLDTTGEEAEWLPNFPWETFAFENVHRNVPLGEQVLLAPYLGVLGLDGKDGEDVDGFMSLNSGVGLDVKLFVSDRFVVAPDVAFRHYWILRDPTSEDGSRFGYTASIRAGFAF
jgi:hypothetical protein